MIILLADSNALRHAGLKAFLRAPLDHAVALSDMTLVEMRKTNALATSRSSLEIVAAHPSQVYVLRQTGTMPDENVADAARTADLIDYEASLELAAHARRLTQVPAPRGLAEECAALERDARMVMARLAEEVAYLEPGLVAAAGDFTKAELAEIRSVERVSDSTQRKLMDLLKETTADFIRRNQDSARRAPMPMREATGLFGFRYSLCMLLYYMEWVRIGRQVGKRLQLRVNDVVDMQVAMMGTFFSGVLSADRNLQTVSNTARGVLRGFGAYVGEDWSPPESGWV